MPIYVCLSRPAQYLADIEATPTRPHPQVKPESGGFEKVVRDLLTSDNVDPLTFPGLKSSQPSQQECFKYLQRCVQGMREKYLLPQQKVKASLHHRCALLFSSLIYRPSFLLSLSLSLSLFLPQRLVILRTQKEQQLRDLMSLRDDCGEMLEKCEDVREKVEEVQQRGSQLLNRSGRLPP